MIKYFLMVLFVCLIAHLMCHHVLVNSSPPGQNGCHFADDMFKFIFLNEKFYISIWISLKFVFKGPIVSFHKDYTLALSSPNNMN